MYGRSKAIQNKEDKLQVIRAVLLHFDKGHVKVCYKTVSLTFLHNVQYECGGVA